MKLFEAFLSSQILEGHPPPAVWWLCWEAAGEMLCGVIRTPLGWSWGLFADGPCPHTCSAEGNSESHWAEWAEQAQNTFTVHFLMECEQFNVAGSSIFYCTDLVLRKMIINWPVQSHTKRIHDYLEEMAKKSSVLPLWTFNWNTVINKHNFLK